MQLFSQKEGKPKEVASDDLGISEQSFRIKDHILSKHTIATTSINLRLSFLSG